MYYKKDTSTKTHAMCAAHICAERVRIVEQCAQKERERADAKTVEEYCLAQDMYEHYAGTIDIYDEIIDIIDTSEFDDYAGVVFAIKSTKGNAAALRMDLKALISKKSD